MCIVKSSIPNPRIVSNSNNPIFPFLPLFRLYLIPCLIQAPYLSSLQTLQCEWVISRQQCLFYMNHSGVYKTCNMFTYFAKNDSLIRFWSIGWKNYLIDIYNGLDEYRINICCVKTKRLLLLRIEFSNTII